MPTNRLGSTCVVDRLESSILILRQKCPILCKVHDVTGSPYLWQVPSGFAGIARIVVGQQLSVASAEAIWKRCEDIIRPMAPDTVLGLDDVVMKMAGLSSFRTFSDQYS